MNLAPDAGTSITITVDIQPAITGSFYIELVNPSDIQCSPQSNVNPAPGDFFGNIRSSAPSIQPRDLEQSYHGFPNPFNPDKEKLTLEYYLTGDADVSVTIFTIYGRLVNKVTDNIRKAAGLHADDLWDGTNMTRNRVKSGVYLCVLEVKDVLTGETRRLTRKMALLR
jgi:hypothetical protein